MIDSLFFEMVNFDAGNAELVAHFTKVHAFARQIGLAEKLDNKTQLILELTALTHDIAITPVTKELGYCNGKLQEKHGAKYAIKILKKLNVDDDIIDRVCYLISHHHTYDNVDGLDYRILLEADFLVNLHENSSDIKAIKSAYENIFVTQTGKKLCSTMFGF